MIITNNIDNTYLLYHVKIYKCENCHILQHFSSCIILVLYYISSPYYIILYSTNGQGFFYFYLQWYYTLSMVENIM